MISEISNREVVTHLEKMNFDYDKIIIKTIKFSIYATDKRNIKGIKEKLTMVLMYEVVYYLENKLGKGKK